MRLIIPVAMLTIAHTLPGAIWWEEESKTDLGKFGGMMAKMPGAAKSLAPKRQTHSCDGSFMYTKDGQVERWTDAAKATVTTIDHGNRTYSVMSLDQLRSQSKKPKTGPPVMPGERPGMAGTMSITETGKTESIAGHTCSEFLVTIGGIKATSCITKAPGWELIRQYREKLGGKFFAGGGLSAMATAMPEDAAQMRQLAEQFKKMDGVPMATRTDMAGIAANVTATKYGPRRSVECRFRPDTQRPQVRSKDCAG